MKQFQSITFFLLVVLAFACKKENGNGTDSSGAGGLKIAYINGDTVLHHFAEFRKESDNMDAKQKQAEEMLQGKGAELEKEILAYQKKAQSGTLTGKEMEAREKYLASRQEALMQERDRLARQFMEETEMINKRLQSTLKEKLDVIQKEEGYDFILSYVDGGPILTANEQLNITDRVIKILNADSGSSSPADTMKK